jgi:DNA-binding GntR family transcriptional regulator
VNLREHAYVALRHRLMSGEFSFRERLAEERLATLLGVSRTPVREALSRLASDGLVEKRPDGGCYLAEPDLACLRNLYEIRVTLELRGLRRALDPGAAAHDSALPEPLRDTWKALRDDPPNPGPAFVAMDEEFHLTLGRSSGNLELANTIDVVNARIRPVRMYDFPTVDGVRLTVEQHFMIVEKVLVGDLEGAVLAFRRHVGESMDAVERRVARAVTRMASNRGRAPRTNR